MGRRRIRLIQKLDPSIVVFGVDSNPQRKIQAKNEFDIAVYSSLDEITPATSITCAFICTDPSSHNGITSVCLNRGWHIFSEINLVSDGYDQHIQKASESDLVLFLSSTFLYKEEVSYIRNAVQGKRVNYTYHVGQYLPDWHPWEHYTEFFVSNKRTNGCREILAIELPWLSNVFGAITEVTVHRGTLSSLPLNYPDFFMLMVKHRSGCIGSIVVDVVSRKPIRNFEVFGEHVHVFWDGTPTGLSEYAIESKTLIPVNLYEHIDHQETYSPQIVENAYLEEIKAFFSAIEHHTVPVYDFVKDKIILSLIDTIEA
jgi:predicted dehydrogenase